jgi:hypothetical protein
MNKLLLMAAGLLLMPLPAFSQSSSGSDERDSSYGRRDRDLEELLRGIGDDMSGGGGARRGAGFLLRSGDATVAVRCDPRDTMRACVEATTTLLERARSALPPGGGGGAPPPGTPPRP